MADWTEMHDGPDGGPTLQDALIWLNQVLPGWWWRVGVCHVSADATIGPDRTGPDAALLSILEFDEGFACDLPMPATPAEALMEAIDMALCAKAARKR